MSFEKTARYPSGPSTYCVAVGDVNGDGLPDVVSSHQFASYVRVFLGKGSGTFDSGTKYTIGGPAQTVALASFNADTNLDIITANLNATNSVSLLLNDGHGGFEAARRVVAGFESADLVVADFNQDTKPDLAVAPFGTNKVTVLLGDGLAGFSNTNSLTVMFPANTIASGDFNGDGIPDLCVEPDATGIAVFLGDGRGGFQAQASLRSSGIERVAVGDFDSDGVLDIVVAGNLAAGLRILHGNGDGTFVPLKDFPGSGGDYRSAVIQDFNGDGTPDIISGRTPLFFRGLGAGKFKKTALKLGSMDAFGLAVADLNGDGRPDLVVADYDGSISVVINRTAPVLGTHLIDGVIELEAPDWDLYLYGAASVDGDWQLRSVSPQVEAGRKRWKEKVDSPRVFYRLRNE